MDKRKGIILAIVLFLIIGLGTFVFANDSDNIADDGQNGDTINDPSSNDDGSDDQTTSDTTEQSESSDEESSGEGGNGSETNPSDTNEEINDGNLTGEGGTEKPSRDDVTTPVVDEVETPVTDGNNANTIDWASLLNKLAQMVNTAEDREDIEAAIEFRKNNNITVENIESLGESAIDSLKIVNAILDDETAPAIEPDLDGKFFKEVSISINDDTKYTFVLERLDGESIPEGTTLDNINLEGEYKLTVVDAAFNETVVTFTIDRNETEETKTTMDVNNATHFDSIEDAVATITDLSLDKVVVENQDTKESVTFVAENGNVEIKLTEEATYKLTAYDKAGNETTYWLAVDETDPTIFFTDSEGNELSDLTNKDVTITAFDKFLTEVTVTDANGNETVYKEFTTNGNNENKTFTLTLGEDGIYTVTAKDKVGRTNTETIEIDKNAPVYSYLSFRVDGDATSGVETYYATKGDIIYVSIATSELLSDDFRFVITDSKGNEFRYKETKDVWTNNRDEYVYQAYIELPEEFAEGKLTATVENVKDLAGNTSEKNLKSDKVVVDRTPIEKAWLYVLNNTYSKTNLEDKHYTVIGDGQELYVELVFEEMPATTPLIQIGNAEAISMDACYATDWDTEIQYYKCPATIKIDSETQELENGQLIPVKITNIKDAAGNETELDTDDITKTDKYDKVVFDNEIPVPVYFGVQNLDRYGTEFEQVIKDGEIIRVRLYFEELLATEPIVSITGTNVTATATYRERSSQEGQYAYYADIKITEDMNLDDGVIEFTVYGYGDYAGNILLEENAIDQTETNEVGNEEVVLDNTDPESLKIQIINNDNPTSSYIKNGETIRVRATFDEALSVMPILTIGNYTATFENVGDGKGNDLFSADIEIPVDEIELAEGKISYTISGYKDLAGNDGEVITKTSELVYDRTASKAGIANFYVSGVDGEVVKENGKDYVDYYATYGNKLVAYVRTTEQLSENPTFTLVYGDTKIVVPSENVVEIPEEKDGYTYRYQVTYVIPENFEEIEKEVTVEITNIVDLAGNITTNENGEDIIGISNSNRVFIDTLAPQINELRFNSSNKIDNGYANNTHSVGVYLTVHEELASDPTFIIDGKSYAKNQGNVSTNGYMYAAVTKLPEDTKEGKLSFSVTVSDKLGNTATYTQDDIKNNVDGYDGVIYDTTDPKLILVGTEETYDNVLRIESGTTLTLKDITAKATDASFGEEVSVEPYKVEFYANTGKKEDNNYTYDFSNGLDTKKPSGSRYNVYYEVTDKAGNKTKDVMLVIMSDTTPATITPNQDDNYHVEYGSEFTPVIATVTDNVDETITNYKPRVYIRYTYPSVEYNTGELYYNNTFNTNIPGYYLAIWDYTDSSGNISNTLKRWVIVSDTTASVIED